MLINCLAACAHLTITVSEIQRDIGRRSSIFSYPLAFDAPVRGVPVGVAPPRLVRKTRMAWLPHGEKNVEDIFIRFGATYERDGQTDGQTDRQTPGDSIYRAYAYASRGNNSKTVSTYLKF